jgi:3-phenylpropionate/trans-cinnamate dioxygenase ferredoxin subunit
MTAMANWIDVGPLEAVDQEDVMRFDHDGKTYAVYRSPADEVFCTDGLCTHEEVHLADGFVMGYEIECPKHQGVFDYRSGEAKRLPPCVDLKTYPTRVEGGRVSVDLG